MARRLLADTGLSARLRSLTLSGFAARIVSSVGADAACFAKQDASRARTGFTKSLPPLARDHDNEDGDAGFRRAMLV